MDPILQCHNVLMTEAGEARRLTTTRQDVLGALHGVDERY